MACSHSSKSLDVVEKALDEIAKTVELFVVAALLFPALAGWNHRPYFAGSKFFDDSICIVSPVAQACASDNIVNKVLCNC